MKYLAYVLGGRGFYSSIGYAIIDLDDEELEEGNAIIKEKLIWDYYDRSIGASLHILKIGHLTEEKQRENDEYLQLKDRVELNETIEKYGSSMGYIDDKLRDNEKYKNKIKKLIKKIGLTGGRYVCRSQDYEGNDKKYYVVNDNMEINTINLNKITEDDEKLLVWDHDRIKDFHLAL